MKIIIVEDEQRARRGLRRLIEDLSETYEIVAEASNGKQGLELVMAMKPDVVITDVEMPFMDGLDMITRFKNAHPHIQTVVISAYSKFEYAKKAITLDAVEYLLKPILYQEIKDVLLKIEKELGKTQVDYRVLKKVYPNVHPLVLKTLKIIELDYAQKISQKELALKLGVTQEYFSSLFSKEMGSSFTRYLNTYRIDMAKAILASQNYERGKIPYQVGFRDEKYFYKIFKDIEGISYSEYLKGKSRGK
ncbi:MAG: response regulator [Eubacteriales bacterium]